MTVQFIAQDSTLFRFSTEHLMISVTSIEASASLTSFFFGGSFFVSCKVVGKKRAMEEDHGENSESKVGLGGGIKEIFVDS